MSNQPLRSSLLGLLVLVLAISGCNVFTGSSGKPSIVIMSPPSGSSYREGDEVAVQSTSVDSFGIVRVELLIDGTVVRNDPSPSPQSNFTVIQTWKATAGAHVIGVRAFNANGSSSDLSAISIIVSPTTAQLPPPSTSSSLPPVSSSASSSSSVTSIPSSSSSASTSCFFSSSFVSDVTVPDNTNFVSGQGFNKIWRMKNNGTCAWDSTFQLVFIGGEAMTSYTAVNIAATPINGTVDILVPMTAPGSLGSHSGTWRIRTGTGTLFGQAITVKINVVGSASSSSSSFSTSASSSSSSATSSACSGSPTIASFSASPNSITLGSTSTLSWGAVTNADGVEIDNGVGGVGTPGTVIIAPTNPVTYTITAKCGPITTTRQTVINVVGNFSGHWFHNFGEMDITQNGSSITGTFRDNIDGTNGTIAGTVIGRVLSGTFQKNNSGPVQLALSTDGSTFDGTWNGSNKWCGAKPGKPFASGCSFSGAWTMAVDQTPACTTLNLTRIDNTVTGTYCDGAVAGTITFTNDSTILNGSFTRSSAGNLVFYLLGYNGLQFQGHWDSVAHAWCGWRSTSAAPSPCGR